MMPPAIALRTEHWRFRNTSSTGNKIVLKIGGHESKFRNPLLSPEPRVSSPEPRAMQTKRTADFISGFKQLSKNFSTRILSVWTGTHRLPDCALRH